MRRWLFLISAAVLIFCVGLGFVGLWEPSTLAKKTVQVGSATVAFRITQTGDSLYAEAAEQRAWSNGFRSKRFLGELTEIGNKNPEIVSLDGGSRVLLHVGSMTIEFDAASKSFRAPRTVP